MKSSRFYQTALAVVRILPAVAAEECFALKGGTALNFFVKDLPRLSVDIDLTYLPIEPRDVSLRNISDALERIAERIKKSNRAATITRTKLRNTDFVTKLVVHDGKTQVKIESNTIIRGSVKPPVTRSLSKKAEDLFEASVDIATLSDADLYAGKFCAALDRQHPRDIFDMKLLLETPKAITADLKTAFVVYLASHNRPMHELIAPNPLDVRDAFDREFKDMAAIPITYEELEAVRKQYFQLAMDLLTPEHKKFLLSLKSGKPTWNLLGIAGIENLPSLQWKLTNIKRLSEEKRATLFSRLEKTLE